MKKILAFTLVITLMIPLLLGCAKPTELPVLYYTNEILINQEALPDDLVCYVELKTPTSSRGLAFGLGRPSYATLDTTKLVQMGKRDYHDILDAKAPFDNDTFFEKITFFFNRKLEEEKHDYELKILGMTSEEFDQKINKPIDINNFSYYNDRVIGVITPIKYMLEEGEHTGAEYSDKNILVDYDYETSVVIPYTEDELKADNNGLYSSNYTGRIGDRYYLTYGYYDITSRKLCPYKDENDLPQFTELLGARREHDLRDVIKSDADAGAYITDGYFIDAYVLIGDRYYVAIGQGNRYYKNDIENYEGDTIFLLSVDATTGKVLYLQRIHLKNYWGYEYKFCTLGEDGILYDT